MATYRGWDLGDMRAAGDYAFSSSPISHSSFTPINTPTSAQPQQRSAPDANHTDAPVAATGRRHHPILARYLGLGDDAETSSLTPPSAQPPPSAPPPRPKRKRATKAGPDDAMAAKPGRAPKAPKQRLVSDGLRATKPTTRKCSTTKDIQQSVHESRNGHGSNYVDHSEADNLFAGINHAESPDTITNDNQPPQASGSTLCNDSLPNNQLQQASGRTLYQQQRTPPVEEDMFDDGIDDDDLMTFMSDANQLHDSDVGTFITPVACEKTVEVTPMCSLETPSARLLDSASSTVRGPSSQFHSPVTSFTRLPSLDMKPIVRPPFPSQVRDRSPVIGLTPDCLLRTCFRVGEAINAGRNAAKNGKNVIIELYARVLSSERDATKQHFVLCDLFHSKPPYLKAEYDAAIWKGVELHEFDSRVFLDQANRMCRCILTTKSNGKEWVPKILNIWAAKEEDIMWVEGIVNS